MAPNCQIEAGSCFGFAKPGIITFLRKGAEANVNPRGQNRPGKDLILPAEQLFEI